MTKGKAEMKRAQLRQEVRRHLHEALPSWSRWKKVGLFRRNEYFVQWLILEMSQYAVELRPSSSVQLLPQQFPFEALSPGEEIRDSQGSSWWLTPETVLRDRQQVVGYIVERVRPLAHLPLTTEAILNYLNKLDAEDQDVSTEIGVANIVLGNFKRGYRSLEKSLALYEQAQGSWAEAGKERIRGWLSLPPDALVLQLQDDARRGAELLGLPAEGATLKTFPE